MLWPSQEIMKRYPRSANRMFGTSIINIHILSNTGLELAVQDFQGMAKAGRRAIATHN